MKKIKVSMQIKFLLAIFLFFAATIFLLININEIFWKMLKKKNYDIAIYDFSGKSAMPFVSQFFYKKSKNQFLISKFGKSEKVAAEFLGWPLQEGDLAWCIWSHNTLTENDYDLLVRKLNLNNGFEIFRYIRGNYERKVSVLNIVSKLEAKKSSLFHWRSAQECFSSGKTRFKPRVDYCQINSRSPQTPLLSLC